MGELTSKLIMTVAAPKSASRAAGVMIDTDQAGVDPTRTSILPVLAPRIMQEGVDGVLDAVDDGLVEDDLARRRTSGSSAGTPGRGASSRRR